MIPSQPENPLPILAMFIGDGSHLFCSRYDHNASRSLAIVADVEGNRIDFRTELDSYCLSAASCSSGDTVLILCADIDSNFAIWPRSTRLIEWKTQTELPVPKSLIRTDIMQVATFSKSDLRVIAQFRKHLMTVDNASRQTTIGYYWGLLHGSDGPDPLFLCDAHPCGRLRRIGDRDHVFACDVPSANRNAALAAIDLQQHAVNEIMQNVLPGSWAVTPYGNKMATVVARNGSAELCEVDCNDGRVKVIAPMPGYPLLCGYVDATSILVVISNTQGEKALVNVDTHSGKANVIRASLAPKCAIATNSRGTYAIVEDLLLSVQGQHEGSFVLE